MKTDEFIKLQEERAHKEAEQLGHRHLGMTSLYNLGWTQGYDDGYKACKAELERENSA